MSTNESSRTRVADDLVVDGRTARRNRNKVAVLDALIELAAVGEAEPAVEAIADHAGVSYRSVYRYFDDRTDLLLSAIGRLIDGGKIFEVDDLGEGALDVRIARLVDVRVAAYHRLAALTRAAVQRRAHEPAVGDAYDGVRQMLREQLEQHFAAELSVMSAHERRLAIAAIDTMIQFESLDFLARHEGMDDASLAEVLTRHVRAHLVTVGS